MQQTVQCFGLRNGPRKAVEERSRESLELFLDDRNDDVVRNEVATVHVCLRDFPELGALHTVLAQHVAGRKLMQAVQSLQNLRLRTLPGTGRPQENYIHLKALRPRLRAPHALHRAPESS